MKRFYLSFALTLCVMLCCAMLPTASAEEAIEPQEWFASEVFVDGDAETVAATLSADGTLTITGSGDMQDFEAFGAPWGNLYSYVTAIEVGSGVTGIGTNAFYSYRYVESVTLPDTLTAIGERAFYGCAEMKAIDIPDGVTTIGKEAFGSCVTLAEITIPAGVTVIPDGAFSGCEKLVDVVIPDGVVSIGANAFWYCSELAYITIPASVTGIGTNAFRDADNLSLVFYGGSATQWKRVSGYSSLSNATVWYNSSGPDENGLIDSWAADQVFVEGDAETVAATLSADGTLTITGEGEMVDFASKGAPWYESRAFVKKVIVESGVTHIGDYAFSNSFDYTTGYTSAIAEVILPETLRSIGNFAFQSNSMLTEIEIPDGVETIGIYAFYNCTKLTSVTLPGEMESIGTNAFEACTKLTSVVLPEGITSVPSNLFYDCECLREVTIPSTVALIRKEAFGNCRALSAVTFTGCKWEWNRIVIDSNSGLSEDVELSCTGTGAYEEYEGIWFADEVIQGSSDHETVAATLDMDGKLVISGSGRLQDGLTTPDGVMYKLRDCIVRVEVDNRFITVGSETFSGCSALTSAVLPEEINAIGAALFSGCHKLREVNIPDTVSSIAASAFSGCGSLESIRIPDGVTTIYASTFAGCSSLKSINIPDGVTTIYESAFAGCSSLTEVNIPAGVTSIGDYAFSNCFNLREVVIPEGVTYIGIRAFGGCNELTEVSVPVTVTNIKTEAFRDCPNLKNIYYAGTEEQLNAIKYDAIYHYGIYQVTTFGSPITAFPIADHDDPPATIHYQSKLPDTAAVNGEGTTIFKYALSGSNTVALKMMSNVPEGSMLVLACYDGNGRLLQIEFVKSAVTEQLTLHSAAASARLMAVDSAWSALCGVTELSL